MKKKVNCDNNDKDEEEKALQLKQGKDLFISTTLVDWANKIEKSISNQPYIEKVNQYKREHTPPFVHD